MNGLPIYLPIQRSKARFITIGLILTLILMTAQPAFATDGNPGVLSPHARPYGKTINAWTANWWQYVMSFPADTNPLADATGANCAVGQSGPVFFLVGTTGGTAVRDDCVVPVGKSILFPIINVISAVPEDATNADDLKSLVTWYFDHVDLVETTVDGVALQNLMADYRFPSPIFSFDGASPGVFICYDASGNIIPCYEGYHDIAFSDGWWVMLSPLPPGAHTIHFKGHQSVPEWGVDFTVEVTYHLTVK